MRGHCRSASIGLPEPNNDGLVRQADVERRSFDVYFEPKLTIRVFFQGISYGTGGPVLRRALMRAG